MSSVPSMCAFVATHKIKENSKNMKLDENNNFADPASPPATPTSPINEAAKPWSFSNLFSNFKFSGHDGFSFATPDQIKKEVKATIESQKARQRHPTDVDR